MAPGSIAVPESWFGVPGATCVCAGEAAHDSGHGTTVVVLFVDDRVPSDSPSLEKWREASGRHRSAGVDRGDDGAPRREPMQMTRDSARVIAEVALVASCGAKNVSRVRGASMAHIESLAKSGGRSAASASAHASSQRQASRGLTDDDVVLSAVYASVIAPDTTLSHIVATMVAADPCTVSAVVVVWPDEDSAEGEPKLQGQGVGEEEEEESTTAMGSVKRATYDGSDYDYQSRRGGGGGRGSAEAAGAFAGHQPSYGKMSPQRSRVAIEHAASEAFAAAALVSRRVSPFGDGAPAPDCAQKPVLLGAARLGGSAEVLFMPRENAHLVSSAGGCDVIELAYGPHSEELCRRGGRRASAAPVSILPLDCDGGGSGVQSEDGGIRPVVDCAVYDAISSIDDVVFSSATKRHCASLPSGDRPGSTIHAMVGAGSGARGRGTAIAANRRGSFGIAWSERATGLALALGVGLLCIILMRKLHA
jgi:hypothetical protein